MRRYSVSLFTLSPHLALPVDSFNRTTGGQPIVPHCANDGPPRMMCVEIHGGPYLTSHLWEGSQAVQMFTTHSGRAAIRANPQSGKRRRSINTRSAFSCYCSASARLSPYPHMTAVRTPGTPRPTQARAPGEAEQDLLSIWSYGSDEWSPEVADHHQRIVGTVCTTPRLSEF